ncbi:hypothetical protein [Sulfuriflexus sp.]|uniref:hypothetical protein n=1 Tax=Sulfuriflexus sp. TaxID=2015443 RepID=UPI0028CFCB1F|nr:hypothetical protein [Sulfuriflexus sp.]MDT8405323.1 hypothetical protein [Sulfuriflexus sp.]
MMMIYKNRITNRFVRLGRFVKAIVSILINIMVNVIGLLASSAKTSDTSEATDNAVRGGVLNYRTGKLDDGTDAAGWYEKD